MRLSLMLVGLILTAQPLIAQQQPRMVKFTEMEVKAAQQYPQAFTIDPQSVVIENLGPVMKPAQVLTQPASPPQEDPIVFIDKIINTMKKIWDIIEENKPVVDIQTTYANAIPQGITHWSQLNQWRKPEGTIYGFYAKNLYGVEVIRVKYQVLRTYGGSYKGKGKYLTAVTVVPLAVDVAWGYDFAMSCKAPSVANRGTAEDPLASMLLNLDWKIATAVKESRGTSIYYLQGDGEFQEMGGPFKKQSMQRVSAKLKSLHEIF
ncbi:MAG: hypothetical protein ABIJ96_02955 [Elusimicrobiota bacterium]